MKNLIIKYKHMIIGVLIGGAAGLAYWHFIGCASGTCAITSVWYRSTLYGAMMGALIGQSIMGKSSENSFKQVDNGSEIK